jgi:hypothetical protein
VPPLELSIYTITSVERIIDELVITRTQGEFYVLKAAQRIQIWGEPIPQPSAAALALFALLIKTNFR